MLLLVNVFVSAGSLAGAPALAQAPKPLHIVAFGDSLSSGYGLKPAQAFPAQLQKQLKARGHNVVVDQRGRRRRHDRRRPRAPRLVGAQ